MSVWIRRGLWGLLALLLVLAALAAWLVTGFDPNRFKGTAVEWMKANHNRTLVLEGPIELSVFPRLRVELSDVRLSEPGRPELFAAVKEAALALELLPLLRGELVVDRVTVRGARVTYLRDAKGRSNVDDLLAPRPGAAPAAEPRADEGDGRLRFDVSGIEVDDLRAHIKDDTAGVDGDLWVRSFTAGRLADGATSPVTLRAGFDFRQPAIQGELTAETRLTLDAAAASAALNGMKLQFKGDVPGASAVDAEVAGSLAWDGERRSVDAQSLTLRFDGNTAGMKFADSRVAIEHFAFDPARKKIDLRRLQARIQGTQSGQPLALELDWPELSVAEDRLGGSGFSGKATRGGELPLAATFRSDAPTGQFDAVRLPGFVAQWSSDGAQRKMQGTLHADLTVRPAGPALALDRLELQARLEEPQRPAYAVAARGSALASSQRSTWNLQGRLNESPFTTEGSATLAGVAPQINAKARFDALDLDRLLGPPAPEGASKGGAPGAGDQAAVDLSGLRALDGQFSLRAGRFAYRQYRLDDAAIDATLQGGMLRVTQLKGRAWGGALDATAFADARASRVAVKGSASGVDVNALVRDLADKDWITGTGRVALDLDTAGRTVGEMKSRLKGSAALQVRDGAIKGINLARTLRQAKAALSLKEDAAVKGVPTEKTDFSELSATFQIAEGVARSRDLELKSPFLRVSGEGAIDVGAGRIDYLARTTLTPSAKGQDAADLGALRGLTVPVRLVGPLQAPDWRIQWSAVAAEAVTQKLQDKIGEKLAEKLGAPRPGGAASGTASPQDVLKDTLKGLFK